MKGPEMNQLAPAAVTQIACDMTALDKDQLKRLAAEVEGVYRRTTELRVLADGFAIGVADADADTFRSMAEVVAHDRLCCHFIHHAIVAEPESKTAWLYLSGGPGVKEYIAGDLRRGFPPESRIGGLLRAAYGDGPVEAVA
jgi:hypothetical protein